MSDLGNCREEDELYVFDLLYAFVKVGDDLTGLKVSGSSLQRRRRIQSIRFWSWIGSIKHRDLLCSCAT